MPERKEEFFNCELSNQLDFGVVRIDWVKS